MSNDWTPDFGRTSIDPPKWSTKRPIRIAILGDFSAGALSGRLQSGADLAKRKPLKVEFDTLEDALARLQLKLQVPLGTHATPVEIAITELESFHPDELYRNLDIFAALSALRKRLNTPSSFAAAAAEVQAWGKDGGQRATRRNARSRARGAAPSSSASLDDFARLTGRAASATTADKSATTVSALLRSLVGPFVVAAPHPAKDALVATVDGALADTLRALLHQPDFQNAESLWRGVDFLLRRLETSHQLQVHLIDLSAEEFAADLSSCDDLSQTGLYKLLVEQPSQDADGGYTYLCGCYQFDATPPHTELLGRAATIAAHAGAPLITAIATDPFTDRREPPHRLVQQAFADLKAMPNASYLSLMGPRFLLRHPYGKRSDPISSFGFEEFTPEHGLRGMLWGHPGLLALCVLGVRGGQLAINDLAFHHYVDADGDSVALPCTDRLINTNASALLRDYGITAVMAHKGEPMVRLSGVEAINGDGLATANTAGRKAPGDSRVALRSRADAADKSGSSAVDWSPPSRSAGTVGVSALMQLAADAGAGADAETETDVDANAAAETDADADEAQVNATVDADESDAAGAEPSELDLLLASLGSEDESAATPAEAAADGAEEAMDPDLAALLALL